MIVMGVWKAARLHRCECTPSFNRKFWSSSLGNFPNVGMCLAKKTIVSRQKNPLLTFKLVPSPLGTSRRAGWRFCLSSALVNGLIMLARNGATKTKSSHDSNKQTASCLCVCSVRFAPFDAQGTRRRKTCENTCAHMCTSVHVSKRAKLWVFRCGCAFGFSVVCSFFPLFCCCAALFA